MAKAIMLVIFGLLAGLSLGYLPQLRLGASNISEPALKADSCNACKEDLARLSAELEKLKKSTVLDPASSNQPPAPEPQGVGNIHEHAKVDAKSQALSWRISAIEKFVPVTAEQREQLEAKFQEEQQAIEEGRESSAESLDQIIGEENARTYRDQVQAAFKRVQDEELEKDALWISKNLGLAADDEQKLRAIFSDVERELQSDLSSGDGSQRESPQQRVTRMIAENRKRVELRSSRLKSVLSPEQYQSYLQAESGSAASDLEIFHEPKSGE